MKLDIALPFYGDVAFLKETVASVLAQTDPNWRLLVVDDGYPDDSLPGWFSGLNDKRIIYQRNENNVGANGNFQKCLKLVTSEYCVVMGADDLLEPNYVEIMRITATQHPGLTMCHPSVTVINDVNVEIETRLDGVKNRIRPKGISPYVVSGEMLASSLMRGNWMYFPAIMWKTKKIQTIGFRSGLNVCQDLALAIDVIVAGGDLVMIDNKLFRYRRHSSSDSSVRAFSGDRFVEEAAFFNGMTHEFKKMGWKRAALAARLHLTSRLHAVTLIVPVIKAKQNPSALLKHLFLI